MAPAGSAMCCVALRQHNVANHRYVDNMMVGVTPALKVDGCVSHGRKNNWQEQQKNYHAVPLRVKL